MNSKTLKITVLDAKPLDAGDVDWAPLRALGDVTLHDNTQPGALLERVADADILFTNKVKLPREALAAATNLQLVGVLATGYDVVDVEAAREKSVTVCNVPSYSAAFTAQSTLALLLELAHHVGAHKEVVRGRLAARAGAGPFAAGQPQAMGSRRGMGQQPVLCAAVRSLPGLHGGCYL
jgi:glycerate dehydrogenase